MKKELHAIIVVLVCILLTLVYGNEPFFDLFFHWGDVFVLGAAIGVIMSLRKGKEKYE